MAPSSRDDPRDSDVSRTSESDQTDQPTGTDEPAEDQARGAEPLDFGAFVSRSVRSSSDRFRGDPSDEESASSRPPRQRRSARYWRDSLREQTGEEFDDTSTGSRR